jgi:hypothetical protein
VTDFDVFTAPDVCAKRSLAKKAEEANVNSTRGSDTPKDAPEDAAAQTEPDASLGSASGRINLPPGTSFNTFCLTMT